MLNRLRAMWQNLLNKIELIKQAFKGEKIDPETQDFEDISRVNWAAVAINKVCNLACADATFNVESDSKLTDGMKKLCKDIETHRFEIAEGILADGDFYIFPSTDAAGELYHSYLGGDRVKIIDTFPDGRIKKAYAVLDYCQPKTRAVYYLLREHELSENGTLTISYKIIDGSGNSANIDYWQEYRDVSAAFVNANHIGFGRYKSPVSSRGLSPVYGVPINFGCGETERELFDTITQINAEFKNGESKLFVDPRSLTRANDGNTFEMPDGIIPLKMSAGIENEIQVFSPEIRFSAHYDKLQYLFELYEQQMGLSRGILTKNDALISGTATAVRRSNSDTIAFIDSVHAALDSGNVDTLTADGVFLNIRPDIWEYNSDYYDPFEDASEQWQRLIDGKNNGAVPTRRLVEWLNPNMNAEQVEEELAAVKEEKENDTASAINAALMR